VKDFAKNDEFDFIVLTPGVPVAVDGLVNVWINPDAAAADGSYDISGTHYVYPKPYWAPFSDEGFCDKECGEAGSQLWKRRCVYGDLGMTDCPDTFDGTISFSSWPMDRDQATGEWKTATQRNGKSLTTSFPDCAVTGCGSIITMAGCVTCQHWGEWSNSLCTGSCTPDSGKFPRRHAQRICKGMLGVSGFDLDGTDWPTNTHLGHDIAGCPADKARYVEQEESLAEQALWWEETEKLHCNTHPCPKFEDWKNINWKKKLAEIDPDLRPDCSTCYTTGMSTYKGVAIRGAVYGVGSDERCAQDCADKMGVFDNKDNLCYAYTKSSSYSDHYPDYPEIVDRNGDEPLCLLLNPYVADPIFGIGFDAASVAKDEFGLNCNVDPYCKPSEFLAGTANTEPTVTAVIGKNGQNCGVIATAADGKSGYYKLERELNANGIIECGGYQSVKHQWNNFQSYLGGATLMRPKCAPERTIYAIDKNNEWNRFGADNPAEGTVG